ncbi:LysR family transcriptional regulator [Streptomyces ipomoeae]|uniref:LysR family transcriptional regulator n=1 Tax=Streptomyces ipomoeae TaxID=103232 RepID=UPI001C679C60|nr:LysR family transcriptional regulator [Streptomyces ipomoeae]MDX2822838.1 LysR family transcriptional regulator [Streptomyces ipomoeae]MDX2875589.1 LysR family transcriptional regulator [Streptomyces ipomoeae]
MESPVKPPQFSLRQLVHFVAVAEEGTPTRAAQRLCVSPSAVSLALGELERALKVQLCVRRKAHGITLTPSGRRLLGCHPTLAPTVLPRLLCGFGERYPRITIDFEERTQDDLQQRMLDGKLDLAVLYDMDALRPQRGGANHGREHRLTAPRTGARAPGHPRHSPGTRPLRGRRLVHGPAA